MHKSVLTALTLMILGCSSATGPSTPEVVATAERISISDQELIRLKIENHGDQSIHVWCGGFSILGQTIEGWEPVRAPACIPERVDIEVPPGGSQSVDIDSPEAGPQYRGAVRFTVSGPTDEWVVYTEQMTW